LYHTHMPVFLTAMKLFYKISASLIVLSLLTSLVCLLGAGRFDFSARIMLALSAAIWLWRVLYRRREIRWARFCCRAFIAGFLAFLISFAGVQGLIAHTQLCAAQSAAELDLTRAPGAEAPPVLIVFGAALRGNEPTQALVCRLEAALDWLRTYPEGIAVLSGGLGTGETISEAEAMFGWLTAHGVDPGRLLLEDRSTDTGENIAYSVALLIENGLFDGGCPVTLVSNGFHLYRIRHMYTGLGWDAHLLAARMPNPGLVVSMAIREYFAIWKMWVF